MPVRDEDIPGLPANAGEFECNLTDCEFEYDDCTRDADCGPDAICMENLFYGDQQEYSHACFAPCQTDADCSTGEICACDTVVQNATQREIEVGVCKPASCSVDADCGDGALCIGAFNYFDWSKRVAFGEFHCQTKASECSGHLDCVDKPGFKYCSDCAYDGEDYACELWGRTCDG